MRGASGSEINSRCLVSASAQQFGMRVPRTCTVLSVYTTVQKSSRTHTKNMLRIFYPIKQWTMCLKTIPVSRVIYILQTIDILLTHSCLRCSECQLIQHHNYPRVQSQWEFTLNPRWRRTRTVNKQKKTIISVSRNSSNCIDDDMASPAK